MTVNRFKTRPWYLVPYEVIRKTFRGSYQLKELDGTPLKKNVAAFNCTHTSVQAVQSLKL